MPEHRPDGKPPTGDRAVLLILVLLAVPFALFLLWIWLSSGTGPWGSGDTPPGPGHI
ncbi:hypothetical protein ACIRVF_17155 [Kitasatospora sp. NPDC101157]|uniref:hypothetical protein n=1 Tax=Kitasatospora sp. NPDC101157 TaxID=3364098 RepID=UPI0037F7CF7B